MKLHDSTDKMFTRPDQTDPLRVTDTTGKVWTLSCDRPPVPTRAFDWSATDEDYDGAPDSATRHRVAHGATREACIADIERIVAEEQGTEERDSECPGHPAGGYCDGTCRQTIRSWLRSADHRELDRALDDGNDLSPAERKFVLDRLAKMERGS